MNKILLSFIFIAAGLLGCHQQPKQQTHEEAQAAASAPSPYFYMQLKGTIANQPVTMHLLKTSPDVYRGYYSYDKIGEPIDIWGGVDSSQQLTLYENSYTDEEITFKGSFDPEGRIKGTWRGAGTSHPFSLKKDFDKAVQFDVYYVNDSSALLPNHPLSPVATATNSVLWPSAGTDSKTANFIKTVISGGKTGITPQQLARKDIDSFLLFYKGSLVDLDTTKLNAGNIGTSWDWTSERNMKVIWNRYPLLVLEDFTYDFTGGAHGNGGATYQVLDLDKRKVLSVNDVFKGDYKAVLAKELELAFRKKYKVPEDESVKGMLVVESIEPNNNFILTNKGVMFSYVPYEIGPYALGQVSLFVPYDHIKEILKEDYSK
jgi:hypothetical protein